MTAYTREQLEAMEPRELDAVVAEVVLGYRWHDCTNGVDYSWVSRLMHPTEATPRWNHPVDRPSYQVTGEAPPFSSSWSGLGVVIERMRGLGYDVQINLHPFEDRSKGLFAAFAIIGKGEYEAIGQTYDSGSLPRAAAIASLLAVQGAVP